jgi:hypothetical protein
LSSEVTPWHSAQVWVLCPPRSAKPVSAWSIAVFGVEPLPGGHPAGDGLVALQALRVGDAVEHEVTGVAVAGELVVALAHDAGRQQGADVGPHRQRGDTCEEEDGQRPAPPVRR